MGHLLNLWSQSVLLHQSAGVGDHTSDSGSGSHQRRSQDGARARTLATLEVTVAG